VSNIPRFAAYAAAFEESYKSDDWTGVGEFFAESAVYEAGSDLFLGGHFEGREAILAYFRNALDRFDRRFESRELTLLEGPDEEGQTLRIRGSATYRSAGVPDLVLVLDEFVTFDGDRIVRLEDRYDAQMQAELQAYLAAHGKTLGVSLEP
jgi:hypothetical protein